MFLVSALSAQTSEGVVMDKETLNPVFGVVVVNTHTGLMTSTDSNGHYVIAADGGDTILFRHTSYMTYEDVAVFSLSSQERTILMMPLVHNMKETTIIGLTKYQQDSVARHATYDHELKRVITPPAPKFTGLGCAGCFGWLADKITGNSKKPRRFRKNFAADDEQQYIDSRYTFQLVSSLTLETDTPKVAAFMNAYPMEYSFARSVTDLELKAWIRNNYRDYIKNGPPKKEEKQ